MPANGIERGGMKPGEEIGTRKIKLDAAETASRKSVWIFRIQPQLGVAVVTSTQA